MPACTCKLQVLDVYKDGDLMPLYSYKCTKCGFMFEKLQKFSDVLLRECPVCGKLIRKVYNPVEIIFSGPGFYSTDSKVTNGDVSR